MLQRNRRTNFGVIRVSEMMDNHTLHSFSNVCNVEPLIRDRNASRLDGNATGFLAFPTTHKTAVCLPWGGNWVNDSFICLFASRFNNHSYRDFFLFLFFQINILWTEYFHAKCMALP